MAQKKEILKTLEELLGDGEGRLTPENFIEKKPVIDHIFNHALRAGLEGTQQIYSEYNLELVQAGGSSPSEGRLGYIKDHLNKLYKLIKEYEA